MTTSTTNHSPPAVHPVDEKLPLPQLAALGLQHVLVMYAGAIAVPLIIGSALKLTKEDTAFLIAADLFCCGLVTIIQSMGIGSGHTPAHDDGSDLHRSRSYYCSRQYTRARS
jgi:NCS2 family nucleobase:cation symporter-2